MAPVSKTSWQLASLSARVCSGPASGSDQPRPISRLGRAGRPQRERSLDRGRYVFLGCFLDEELERFDPRACTFFVALLRLLLQVGAAAGAQPLPQLSVTAPRSELRRHLRHRFRLVHERRGETRRQRCLAGRAARHEGRSGQHKPAARRLEERKHRSCVLANLQSRVTRCHLSLWTPTLGQYQPRALCAVATPTPHQAGLDPQLDLRAVSRNAPSPARHGRGTHPLPAAAGTICMAARSLLVLSLAVRFASPTVVISEVADKGSTSQCGADNEDWVELHNRGSSTVALAGWKLHDDKGPSDSKAFTFPSTRSPLAAGTRLLLCTRMDDATTSPQFKIGGDDTISLLDASGAVVSSTGALQGMGAFDLTWAYNAGTSSYQYTSTPTPGEDNVFSDSWPALRARLTKQHDNGEAFFEASSVIAAGRLPPVVEVRLTLSAEDWAYQQENVSFEVYKPFTGLTVTSGDGYTTHATLANGGRARPRGMRRDSNPGI